MIGKIYVKPWNTKPGPNEPSIFIFVEDGVIPNQAGRAIMNLKEVGNLISQLETAIAQAESQP